jgi:hypothetical protein
MFQISTQHGHFVLTLERLQALFKRLGTSPKSLDPQTPITSEEEVVHC